MKYFIISLITLVSFFLIGYRTASGAVMPVELNEAKINIKHILSNGHDPLMTGGSLQNKEVNLHLDTTLFRYGYWNNRVWSLADQHQFRWIGWQYLFGVRLTPYLDIEYSHFSKHILDKPYPYRDTGARFPVEDAVGFSLYLFRVNKAPASIF